MPLYEYACLKCGRHTDKIEAVAGPHLKKCPHCGGKVESVITAPAIKFKGSGWYVNDYAAKPSGGAENKKSDGDSKDSGSKDAGSKEAGSEKNSSKDSAKNSGSKESSTAKETKEKKSAAKKD